MQNKSGVLTKKEIKSAVKQVADVYDIKQILLFGSYYDGTPTADSDLDFIVSYGENCRGLKRIAFAQDLEESLGKDTDILSRLFLPPFIDNSVLNDRERVMYEQG